MTVLSHLQMRGSSLVLTETEKLSINISISELKTRLLQWFDKGEISEMFVFGSYDRGTILPRKNDPGSDVDFMIIFNNPYNLKPQTFLSQLRTFVESKYSTSVNHQSYPTIVLELNHIRFELVPAIRSYIWSAPQIPSPSLSYEEWMITVPSKMKTDITDKNIANSSLIKPLVRLLKYWNVRNNKVYTSYELENHIVSQSYYFCYNLEDYFYCAVESLPTRNLPDYKKSKVEKLKRDVAEIKSDNSKTWWKLAEPALKKIIP